MDSTNPIGAPRLVDFSCQTSSKTSPSDPGNTSATCLLQMKIQENASTIKEAPKMSTVVLEFQKPTLDTLLDGLGRIRDQLSNVANRK